MNDPGGYRHSPFRSWVAVLGAILGAFMAVLDIVITNSSLKEIQSGLGATLDEGSWVSTAYLVAEIVVIPLAAWLASVFSTRRYLLATSALFILFSICCAQSRDLTGMIVFRALQGFTGGALIPMAFTVLLSTLPADKQPAGLAFFALTATFAPAIGPTIGGWLTESLGWQYIFYLNIIPGVVVIAALWYALPAEPMNLKLLKNGDWAGIFTMAAGLAALEIVLEEGERNDWFGSRMITAMALLAAVFIPAFIVIELRRQSPLLNLRLLARGNFALSMMVDVGLGLALYGSVYILPMYLAQVQDYNALQTGNVMLWIGVPQLLILPVVSKLMKLAGPRPLIVAGLALFAASCFMNSFMTRDTAGMLFLWPSIVRALGQPLIMLPLSSLAMDGIRERDMGSASSLFNALRNLGGSIGIASLATLLTTREQFHSARIGESVSLYNPGVWQRIQELTAAFAARGCDAVTAQASAIAQLDRLVRREAFVMAFNDCFYFVGCALAVCCVFILSTRKLGKTAPGAPVAAH